VLTLLVFIPLELIFTSSGLELVLNLIGSCIALLVVSASMKVECLVYQTLASDFGH
jgi:hypothetical protein